LRDKRNSYVTLIAITRLVDEIKNTGCCAEPPRTIFKSPHAIGFRQPIEQSLNKMISALTPMLSGVI
jgi:hypothetical protein